MPRPPFRFRGSPHRVRQLTRRHGRQAWWILATMVLLELAAVLTWALVWAS